MSILDVLIVGGGPTGLMLALELSLHNISFRIIDSALVRSDKSRATVMHPRTLEVLNRHGIANKFLEDGYVNFGSRAFVQRKFVFEMYFEDNPFQDTAFPFPLMISQADTERILDEALLEKYGKKVEHGIKADNIFQDEEGVTTLLRREDGREEKIRSKYIVGCDGAHSTVRKAANLSFDGSIYPHDFILADVSLKWDLTSTQQVSLFMGHGFCAIFPMKSGLYRLVCTRPEYLGSTTDPTLKDFEDCIARLVPGNTQIWNPTWMTRFHIHHRIASGYSNGRMFIAGDAAHIHSPAGGQGMNTGMQDTVNLAWKLAGVLRGERPESILDTYNTERRKVGAALLNGTDKAFEFMATTNPVFLFLRNTFAPWILPWVMKDAATRISRFRFLSQLNVRYRNSPIVGQASSWVGKIKGGDRAPDGKLGDKMLLDFCIKPIHHLVLFSGVDEAAVDGAALEESAEEFLKEADEIINVVKVLDKKESGTGNREASLDVDGQLHQLYGFKEPGFVLVRPDGHICFLGPLDAMEELSDFWQAQKEMS